MKAKSTTFYGAFFFVLFSFWVSLASAQELVNVTGTVVSSEDNLPMQGVTVILKGTARGTNTNAEGNFTLQLTTAQRTDGYLVFSSTGFNRQEVKIGGRANLKVSLGKDVMVLKDVIVTNSYTKARRKEEVVGSIATVSAEELQANRPIESIDKMLEGLAAGVQVETSTELGTPVKINIRGQNSLTNLFGSNRTQLTTSSQPLFIVDGVPVIEQRRGDEPIQFLNNEQLLNPIAGINPDDIESISVLKDAAAASIYGANASNGVIIITTKKGKAGKTRINVGYSGGWSQSINRIKWLDGNQYYNLVKELYRNDGRSPFDAELLAGASDINTPWFELVNRYGTFQNIDLDMSGGSESHQFYISGSYLGQQSIQKGNDYMKAYVRMRLDNQLTKKLSLSISLAPTLTRKNALNLYAAVPIIPNVPVYNADGSLYKFSNLGVPNPLAILEQNTNVHDGGSINGKARLEYALYKNLRFSSTFGIDGALNKQTKFDSPKNATGESKNGFAQIYDRTNFSWISSTQANWSPEIDLHKMDVVVGFEAQSQSTKLLRGEGTGFSYARLTELSNAQNQSSASSRQNGSSISVYGQGSYSFASKYFVTASGRYDAASIFGTDVNATVNAAAGLGWIISKEHFLENVAWLDMLRVRASYGSTGNSRIGSYEARGLYTFNNTGYNGMTASNLTTAPNANLGWEKNYKTNVGLDFNFLKRINLTLDVYQNIVDDAISPITTPSENGFTTTLANIAKMRNRGWEAGIVAQVLKNKVSWTSTLNLGSNRNVVLEVKNNSERYASSNEQAALLKMGVSTSAIWGFEFAGIDPQTGFEMFRDNTGKVVSVFQLDRNLRSAYYLGDRLPTVHGGFINNFNYKGLTLTINLLYSIGAKKIISYENENNGRNLQNRNQSVNLLDRWQKPGDITSIPKLSTLRNPIVSNSSRYIYDDTYLKLSNVSLAYALPKSVTGKMKGIRMSVFLNGTNLFYWYKQKSPEGRNGIKEYKFDFPEAQSYTWGLKLGI